MRRTAAFSLSASVALSMLPSLALAQPPSAPPPAAQHTAPVAVEHAPPPAMLIAQYGGRDFHDPDLDNEETLEDLINIEVSERSQSVGAAVALSFLPGGGWGLLYAGRKAQAVVPFVLSAVGYGVGAAYLAGSFDTSSKIVCRHAQDGILPDSEFETCFYKDDPIKNKEVDPRAYLPENRDPFDKYVNTKGDYKEEKTGKDFDGAKTGWIIIAATYAATTILGAAWAGSAVASDNDRLRRDAESTASLPMPYIGYNGDRGVVGVSLDF